jgi:hypothetical protein
VHVYRDEVEYSASVSAYGAASLKEDISINDFAEVTAASLLYKKLITAYGYSPDFSRMIMQARHDAVHSGRYETRH